MMANSLRSEIANLYPDWVAMNHSTLKILHVEDDATDAMLTHEVLRNELGTHQLDVVHVDSLKSALEELRGVGFDAVLLDLNLRDISGLDNVKAIKEQNPDLPVVVLTGVDSDITALEAIESGAQEYLVKGHGDGRVIRLAIYSSIRRKAHERKLYREANYDDVTGLPNRRMFQNYVERALQRAKRWKRNETIAFIDLDHFKRVNDTLGHEAGNAMLREAALRMKNTLRETDIIARYGGDEFVILLDDHSPDVKSVAGQVVTKLLYVFNEPFQYQGHAVEFSASIGVAVYPFAGRTYASLIKSADVAMYQAKKAGGHQFRFAALG